jgi:muramidase (phage lysozyme)
MQPAARVAIVAAAAAAVYVGARAYMRAAEADALPAEGEALDPYGYTPDPYGYTLDPTGGDWQTDYPPILDYPATVEPPPQEIGTFTSAENLLIDGLRGTWDRFTMQTDTDQAAGNRAAFLMMIRTAEGTADANGYRALFGHTPRRPKLFQDFSDHPRIAASFTDKAGRTLYTTAAGAYQFLAVSPLPNGKTTRVDTWDRLKRKLSLPDFGPESQDAAALELIREAGALADVEAGRFDTAVSKIRRIWASMPGAGYAQPEKDRESLAAVYQANGGTFA